MRTDAPASQPQAPAPLVSIIVRSMGRPELRSALESIARQDHPAIEVHPYTALAGLEGEMHLARVRWRNSERLAEETRPIRHVFVMTGATPSTSWVDGCLALDANGFVKTGPELSSEELAEAGWPLGRAPYLLETSAPGVFAVGDVRSGNIKRVASAVGEGSIAISFVHRVLAE